MTPPASWACLQSNSIAFQGFTRTNTKPLCAALARVHVKVTLPLGTADKQQQAAQANGGPGGAFGRKLLVPTPPSQTSIFIGIWGAWTCSGAELWVGCGNLCPPPNTAVSGAWLLKMNVARVHAGA